jgi:hypothetical protein
MKTTTTATTETSALQRPRYFARQLVTPGELNLGTDYVLERLRRHNRLLHGWGVVCGLKVCRVPGSEAGSALPWKVAIEPGHAIDGHGNDLTVDCERVVDLRAGVTAAACGDPPGEVRDPWCTDVWTKDDGGRVWVAVCYHACRSRPVRAQPSGCGCDDTTCEYSRWVDGYEVRILDECPETHQGPPPTFEQMLATLTGPLRECPAWPEDPCVVLAAIDVGADGTITAIDNCSCRRNVLSAATLWWRCAVPMSVTAVSVTTDGPYTPGAQGIVLHVEGVDLSDDVIAALGPGVTVTSVARDDQGNLDVTVDIADDATPGDRTLTLTRPDCSMVSWAKALAVAKAG